MTETKTYNEASNTTRRQVLDAWMIETPKHTDQRAQYQIKNDQRDGVFTGSPPCRFAPAIQAVRHCFDKAVRGHAHGSRTFNHTRRRFISLGAEGASYHNQNYAFRSPAAEAGPSASSMLFLRRGQPTAQVLLFS